VFRSVFADIGDEQSNRVQPEHLRLAHHEHRVDGSRPAVPALVLLDEIGAGTDPLEGGALGAAIVDHFRRAARWSWARRTTTP
jgi:DNA mismatch repair protein MutS2